MSDRTSNTRKPIPTEKSHFSRRTYPTAAHKASPNRTSTAHRSVTRVPDLATSAELAEWCAVSVRTARRWRARGTMPAMLAAWAAILTGGDLGSVDERWKGWRIQAGELYGPDLAHGFKPADVLSLPYVQAQVKHYQREQRFPRQADALSGAYERVKDAPALPSRQASILELPAQPAQDQDQHDTGQQQRQRSF